GQGGTGNLPSIPLNGSVSHSRSSHWDFSGKQSQIYLDARVPSAWGEVKAFVSMDFSAANTNTILNNVEGSTNGYIPRFREGYVTWGGLLAGQTNGTFDGNGGRARSSRDIGWRNQHYQRLPRQRGVLQHLAAAGADFRAALAHRPALGPYPDWRHAAALHAQRRLLPQQPAIYRLWRVLL